jgi:hypothetical protein
MGFTNGSIHVVEDDGGKSTACSPTKMSAYSEGTLRIPIR